jgi:hypothetical protein
MKLETHEGEVAATVQNVASVVAGLTEVGEAYVVLSEGDETYVQAAGTVGEEFIVERRDGCAGEHYRADRRVAADELVALLVGYLRGDPDWSRAIAWHRVRVERDAPSA